MDIILPLCALVVTAALAFTIVPKLHEDPEFESYNVENDHCGGAVGYWI